jgi:hypothetical protein
MSHRLLALANRRLRYRSLAILAPGGETFNRESGFGVVDGFQPRRSILTATIGWEHERGTDGDDWLGYCEGGLSAARGWKEWLCRRSATFATVARPDNACAIFRGKRTPASAFVRGGQVMRRWITEHGKAYRSIVSELCRADRVSAASAVVPLSVRVGSFCGVFQQLAALGVHSDFINRFAVFDIERVAQTATALFLL